MCGVVETCKSWREKKRGKKTHAMNIRRFDERHNTRRYKRKLLNQYIYIDSISNGFSVAGVSRRNDCYTNRHISHLCTAQTHSEHRSQKRHREDTASANSSIIISIESNQIKSYTHLHVVPENDVWRHWWCGWEDFWFNINTLSDRWWFSGCGRAQCDEISTIRYENHFHLYLYSTAAATTATSARKKYECFLPSIVLVNV